MLKITRHRLGPMLSRPHELWGILVNPDSIASVQPKQQEEKKRGKKRTTGSSVRSPGPTAAPREVRALGGDKVDAGKEVNPPLRCGILVGPRDPYGRFLVLKNPAVIGIRPLRRRSSGWPERV